MKKKIILIIVVTLLILSPLTVLAEPKLSLTKQTTFGGSGEEVFMSVTLSYDKEGNEDGIVVVGATNSTDIDGIINKVVEDGIIVKYDLDGNIVWKKSYGGSEIDGFNMVTTSYDIKGKIDGYIAVGNSNSTDIEGLTNKGYEDAIIVKYDLEGNVMWQKNYGGNNYDYFQSVMPSYNSNGQVDGYTAVGYTESINIDGLIYKGSRDVIIVKYDLEGTMVWQNIYGGSEYEEFF